MNIEAAVLPPIRQTLNALTAIMTKAEAHCAERKIEPGALLNFRLFPDMLPFNRQVHLVCDHACRATARVIGEPLPSFPDVETTFPELKGRIEKVLAFIGQFPTERFDGAAEREVQLKIGGRDMTFSGQVYLSQFALPNFYFHATTAYNILRHNGVPLGKMDFMGA